MDWNREEAIAYYRGQGAPGDQTALTALLKETQQVHGGAIPQWVVKELADGLGTKESLLLALIRRLPSLRLADSHCLEICGGPNCPRKADLMSWVEAHYGEKPTKFILKQVPCMRLCGKGPNIRLDGTLYHGINADKLRKLLDDL